VGSGWDSSDKEAGRLFVEFAEAFKGKRQLTWSPGLKRRFGIGEVKASAYVSKWGLEDEMTKGHTKKAAKGETPFDFLRAVLAWMRQPARIGLSGSTCNGRRRVRRSAWGCLRSRTA
jgi:hypothetical protein